jgi:ADP-ribose pyrophosphatase YjhB (NUDIX family)
MRIWAAWIIIKNKRILLTKRSNYTKAFPMYWTFPGGRWNDWETPEEVVVREIKEEINLNFIPTKIFQSNIIDRSGEKISTNRFLWTFSWNIQIQEEEVDWFAWYTYEETLDLKIAFDYPEILKKLNEEWYL